MGCSHEMLRFGACRKSKIGTFNARIDCATIIEIDLDATRRDRDRPEQADWWELRWVEFVDLCAARTGQEHFHSNKRERPLVLLSVGADKRSRHEPHISILIERKRFLIAGLDVRPRDIAT